MPKCNRCGADIEWMKTQKGKNVPVNAKPVPIKGRDGQVFKGYQSHFGFCTDSQEQPPAQQEYPNQPPAEDDLPW